MSEADSRVDRRRLVAAAVAGLVVVGFVGFRWLGTTGAPIPPVAPVDTAGARSAPDVGSTSPTSMDPGTVSSATDASDAPRLVISEEQLRGAEGVHDLGIVARAEWFVTDYFTRDGSPETVRSLREALVPDLRGSELPHPSAGASPQAYVEWARASVVSGVAEGVFSVTVLYRTIEMVGGAFERLPVRRVDVDVRIVDGVPMVASIPGDGIVAGRDDAVGDG